eukprot:8432577-Lingulodinium_polyedra.AAC.1
MLVVLVRLGAVRAESTPPIPTPGRGLANGPARHNRAERTGRAGRQLPFAQEAGAGTAVDAIL